MMLLISKISLYLRSIEKAHILRNVMIKIDKLNYVIKQLHHLKT
mgnify:CR=1 FL=1